MTPDTDPPILIVEDDEATQNLLHAMLRRWGYTSDIVANGRDAIALLERNEYRTVVLDMMMPSVSGREVIDFLAATPKPVPVIVCSAAGPAALDGLDPGVVKAIVRKPFDIDQFMAVLARVAPREAADP